MPSPSAAKLTIQQVNRFDADEFTARLGGVFEDSPWVAGRVVGKRPFRDRAHLLQALGDAVRRAKPEQQLALIRAHPDLVGRAAAEGRLTPASGGEQAAAGLDRLGEEERRWFDRYNSAYREKFGHPFVLCLRAVKARDKKDAILESFEIRMHNDPARERATALNEAVRIAEFRLAELVE